MKQIVSNIKKLQFEGNQSYQLAAVQSVIDVFEGQPLAKGDLEVSFAMEVASIAFTEKGIGNNLILTDKQILKIFRLCSKKIVLLLLKV